jgi:hypothetical protein
VRYAWQGITWCMEAQPKDKTSRGWNWRCGEMLIVCTSRADPDVKKFIETVAYVYPQIGRSSGPHLVGRRVRHRIYVSARRGRFWWYQSLPITDSATGPHINL